MHLWDIKLPDDSPEWREYQESARRNADQLQQLADAIRGEAPKRVLPLRAPTVEEIKRLRDNWQARAKQPKPTLEKVREQFKASARNRAQT